MATLTDEPRVSDAWREIARVVDHYEEMAGERLPEVTPLLESVSPPNRSAALKALLQVDQEHRWKRGQGKTVEQYLAEHRELQGDLKLARELAQAECRLRCTAGDTEFRREFSQRFPDLELECDTSPVSETPPYPVRNCRCQLCPQVRPRQVGRYVVEHRIGAGAFGIVYRCRHPELGRTVAVKVARRASAGGEGLLHEAQNVAVLSHPNIVRVLDFGRQDDGCSYIVYEYVAGRTLAARIAAQDYTFDEAIDWVIALAGALQAAHRLRIYHRDLKPANVLVDDEGVAHLADFGLARRDEQFYLDDRGMRLGTPCYMSPEQAAGRSDWAGPAADIYSLGVVLYELLCGRVPFRDTNIEELVTQIQERAPVPPRSLNDRIPAQVEEACLRALAKDPALRFRTAGDFAKALQAAGQPASRRAWLVGVAALALVAGWRLVGLNSHAGSDLGKEHPAAVKGPSTPLQLKAPKIDLVRNRTRKEITPRVLPRAGDPLRIKAELAEGKAHLYVILLSSCEPAQVLWPGQQPNQDAAGEACVFCPAPDRHLTVPPGFGVMTVLVGATREPLPAGQLDGLTTKQFDWPTPLTARELEDCTRLPACARNAAESPEHLLVRGSDAVFDLPTPFKQEVERVFETYYAVMFPWYIATPQDPASTP